MLHPSDARVGERGGGGKGLCKREEGEVFFLLFIKKKKVGEERGHMSNMKGRERLPFL